MARFSGANTFADHPRARSSPTCTAYMLVGFINTMLFAINTEATLAVIGLSQGRGADARLDHLLGAQLQRALHRQLRLARRADRRDDHAVPRPLPASRQASTQAFANQAGCRMIRLNNVVASYRTGRGSINAVDGVTLDDSRRLHRRRRRRIRLRQVHPDEGALRRRELADGAGRGQRRVRLQGRARRRRSPARTSSRQWFKTHLLHPAELDELAEPGGEDPRRSSSISPAPIPTSARARARARLCRQARPAGRVARRLSAPAFGRHAPAHHDRDGDLLPARS